MTDWHTVVAVITIASMLIGALVELVYRPARMNDIDNLWAEVNAVRERVLLLEVKLKHKTRRRREH